MINSKFRLPIPVSELEAYARQVMLPGNFALIGVAVILRIMFLSAAARYGWDVNGLNLATMGIITIFCLMVVLAGWLIQNERAKYHRNQSAATQITK